MGNAISVATRNALFSRAGNRCAICKTELVSVDSDATLLNIGKICHMFPQGKNGPRSSSQFSGDINGYDNLILLCGNHHDLIDQLHQEYSIDRLKAIKASHEKWVYDTLQNDSNAFPQGEHCLKILSRMTSGAKLSNLFSDTSGYVLDYTAIEDIEERKAVCHFFDYLKDYAEISFSLGLSEKIDFEQEIESQIETLAQMGVALFGIRRKFNSNELGTFDTATVVAIRNDSPLIANDAIIARLHKSAFGN